MYYFGKTKIDLHFTLNSKHFGNKTILTKKVLNLFILVKISFACTNMIYMKHSLFYVMSMLKVRLGVTNPTLQFRPFYHLLALCFGFYNPFFILSFQDCRRETAAART